MAKNPKMKILIDIGHPGHVHLFRHFTKEMQKKGHEFIFTCREKEFEIELLEKYDFKYVSFGKKYKSIRGKIVGLFVFNIKLLRVALKFKPDLFLSAGSMYAAQVSFLLHKPHITLEDTGNAEQVNLYKPFTEVILTSNVFHVDYGIKQVRYSGYHELAYLHPDIYKPDEGVKEILGLKESDKAVLIRFVSWNASHDIGQVGFSHDDKIEIVNTLSKKHKVFISSESELPVELEAFKLKVKPEKIHDVMAAMSLFIGEGATMASECAMLGTPAIYVNTMEAGSIDDQCRYGLVYHFKESNKVLDKALEILNSDNIKSKWIGRRDIMLSNKINVTKFLVWFISNWPRSFGIIKNDSDYQSNFK